MAYFRIISCKSFHLSESPRKPTKSPKEFPSSGLKLDLEQVNCGINTEIRPSPSPYRFRKFDISAIPESKTPSNRPVGSKLRPRVDFGPIPVSTPLAGFKPVQSVRVLSNRRPGLCPSLQRRKEKDYIRRVSPLYRSMSRLNVSRKEVSLSPKKAGENRTMELLSLRKKEMESSRI